MLFFLMHCGYKILYYCCITFQNQTVGGLELQVKWKYNAPVPKTVQVNWMPLVLPSCKNINLFLVKVIL